MFKLLFNVIKILLVVGIIGGGIYFIMDYNEKDENSFLESTKEFSEDLIDKTKDILDSTETIQDWRKK